MPVGVYDSIIGIAQKNGVVGLFKKRSVPRLAFNQFLGRIMALRHIPMNNDETFQIAVAVSKGGAGQVYEKPFTGFGQPLSFEDLGALAV